jgi:hypothetical protein
MLRKIACGAFWELLAALVLVAWGASAFAPAATAQSVTGVSVTPKAASVHVPGGMQQFDAKVVTGGQNRSVRWSLSGPGCRNVGCGRLSETFSASGDAITYTAPARVPFPAVVTLTATSISNNSKKFYVTITLTGSATAGRVITVSLDCGAAEPGGCAVVPALVATIPATL